MRTCRSALLGSLSVAFLLAACSSNAEKEATETAVNAAESAVAGAQGDAAKYVPDQVNAAQSAMQSAKDSLARGNYQAALASARVALDDAKSLGTAATEKKKQLSQEWISYTETIPKALDETKRRIDAYSHGAKRPIGLDDDVLEQAKTQQASLRQDWSDAVAAYQQGDLFAALQKASTVNDALPKLRELLEMKT